VDKKGKYFTAIVLAAGKGKRMKSAYPKVLYELAGKPLIYYTLQELLKLKKHLREIIIVVGYKGKVVEAEVRKCLFNPSQAQQGRPRGQKPNKKIKINIKFVYQKKMLGTANAVEIAARRVNNDNILVLCADTPLITYNTLSLFISFFTRDNLSGSILTANLNTSSSLGVILRDESGRIMRVQEKLPLPKEVNPLENQNSEEVNSGIYCFKREKLLENLPLIKKNKIKGEYFLTDIVELFYDKGESIGGYLLNDAREILGINTPQEACQAEEIMRQRILDDFLNRGVKIVDPKTTFIQNGVSIGKNSIIYPFTFIDKGVIIGRNCLLGPFVHLRKGTCIKDNTQIGNFVEINRTKIGNNVKVKHFSYLGDAFLGNEVNIGAGTVVANFDGKFKHKTVIEKQAFIGSDTVLVAPVKIGKAAATGAGSVVTKNVKAKTVVVGVPARVLKKKR
jgi:bifunctional UDP-N-acetylglucosamine pyrophosphorylase/glucosamine-1-phosphate N-acetyltransferase